MMLFWKIRYLDRTDKLFKDRFLRLLTTTLDPVARAAVELVVQNKSSKTERDILKYRHLFIEGNPEFRPSGPEECGQFICLQNYFEDETGKEIAANEVASILTGGPTAVLIPSGVKQHDLDLILAERKPIPDAGVSLTTEEVRILGYFARDLKEMLTSAFIKESPATISCSELTWSPNTNSTISTAATDEEIRSFVTIFRRLYMEGEPANFQKAARIFEKALGDHPYAKWVAGAASEFQKRLAAVPDFRPVVQAGTCAFTTKRLIDVFLYTQYAHQPDEKRQRQFAQCLAEVHGKRDVLTWLFLNEIWKCGLEIGNAGRVISAWFRHWCEIHRVSPDVLGSLRDAHSGLGAVEKEEDRRARLFQEKVEELAEELWKQNGRPAGGPREFRVTAQDRLTQMLEG